MALAVGLTCSSPEAPPTTFIVQIDSVLVPSSVEPDEPTMLKLFGIIGPNLCYRFKGFEAEKTNSRLDLTVFGIVPDLMNLRCAAAISVLRGEDHSQGKEYFVAPPLSDPFLVVIHQPDGSTLEKTIRVLSP